LSKQIVGGSSDAPSKNIIVLGVGNELLSDEGFGVYVAKEMHHLELPSGVEVLEAGTEGFGLIHIISEADRLIVIDSIKGGTEPGTIYKFNIEDVTTSPDMFKTSVHQIGILEVINLSGLIGKTPETTVIGVEPKCIATGMELTPEIKAKVPRVIELVREEVDKYLFTEFPNTGIAQTNRGDKRTEV